ncbi:hypothetical protein L210DRAFT_3557584, partial [Boletus edulis BED1]
MGNSEREWRKVVTGFGFIRGTIVTLVLFTSFNFVFLHFDATIMDIHFVGRCVEMVVVGVRYIFFVFNIIHEAKLEYVRKELRRQVVDEANPSFWRNEGVVGQEYLRFKLLNTLSLRDSHLQRS